MVSLMGACQESTSMKAGSARCCTDEWCCCLACHMCRCQVSHVRVPSQDATEANDTFDDEPGSARALHRDASTRSFADADGLSPPQKATPATGRIPYFSKLESIASSAVRAADKVKAALIIVYTQSGGHLIGHRPRC